MNRRKFVRIGAASAGGLTISGCAGEETSPRRQARRATGDGLTREAILELADATAQQKIAICHHCAQSTFLALQEVFGLEGDEIVKALTPLPGIAERGETCGAVIGALMAMGLVYGRDSITDWETWRKSLVPARAFCERFEERFGSTTCSDVVESQFGERLDLYDADDHAQFLAHDPTTKCGEVVGHAARLAADLIRDADPGSA
jgi:C_GCAxxG_C_C family probable redox protein